MVLLSNRNSTPEDVSHRTKGNGGIGIIGHTNALHGPQTTMELQCQGPWPFLLSMKIILKGYTTFSNSLKDAMCLED